ncbi:MAG: hypothetical protein ACNI3C_03095 [Candidatus Marinarcus sp.]|uniref:hypothetical protein n=1 Tax=Candidatus Marinarcus sp. TaxID=3100987 RepID=UPI003B00CB1E
MKKELWVFVSIFLVLSLGMHYKEWLTSPFEHIVHLKSSGAYGIGAIHPLIFTLIVYLIIGLPRGIVKLIKKKG